MKKIVNELNVEMKEIFSYAKLKDCPPYSDVAIICKGWFDSSKEKEEFQNIRKKLKSSNKNN